MVAYKNLSKKSYFLRDFRAKFEIICQYFQDGSQGVWFGIRKKASKTNEIMKLSASEIFYNDKLLEQFDPKDIRTIVYFATCELLASDKILIPKKIFKHK